MESKLDYFIDPNFKFDEASHTYTYLDPLTGKSVQTFQSVTNFLGQFKEKFDSDFWANKKAKQLGVTKQSILNEWKNTSDIALTLGTNVHKWIEDFYNGENPPEPTHPVELARVNQFKSLYSEKLHKFTAVRQEYRLFSKKWGLAGTTDAIFKLGEDYYVGDWKTNAKFTTDEHPKGKYKKLLWPFDDLWENSLNSYSIQLSLYRLILQEEAGFETKGAFLVWIGPESKPQMHKTVDLRDRLHEYLKKK